MNIEYKINASISTEQFIALLNSSGLAERRPVQDLTCMQGMITNSNLTVSAWNEGELIGLARSMTDFHYACYLSDLAVNQQYQKSGIGKELQRLTQQELGPRCKLILIAAPSANTYYGHIGFSHNPRCWVLEPTKQIID
ncbi:MAG: GNAT family N-acetyltransferase [Oceanospirillaceae bacterium]|nr:GNAT family N-acetyltransferase [Oceanospirillaceae bacterium]